MVRTLGDWDAQMAELSDHVTAEELGPRVPGQPQVAPRRLYRVGQEQARERVWIEAAGPGSALASGLAQLLMLRSLAGTGVSRYRHLALGRTQFAFVLTEPERFGLTAEFGAPHSHALWSSAAGPDSGLGAAQRAFRPTLFVRLEDWSRTPVGVGFARAGLRQLESFHLAREVHDGLAAAQRALECRPWWAWRPARRRHAPGVLAGHPGALLGAFARRYVSRMGFKTFGAAAHRELLRRRATWGALALDVGRYAVMPEVRRLRPPLPSEEALWQFGAEGVVGQTFDDALDERVGEMVALVEAVTLYRLGLERG